MQDAPKMKGEKMIASRTYGQISGNPPPHFLSVQNKLQYCNHWEYDIQDGFRISSLQFEFSKKVCLEYKNNQPVLNFGYILSGNYSHRILVPGHFEQTFAGDDGTSGIVYFPSSEGALIIPGKTVVHVVHIHISLPIFQDLFFDEKESVPGKLQALLQGRSNQPYTFITGMSLKIRSNLDRLMQGPPQGAPSSLFFRGTALELIAEQIARANTCQPEQEAIRCHNQSQIIHARKMLIQDLSDSPNLKQLSRETGLNPNKLQQGFNLLYGLSVNKYLQQCRMKEANRLFHETDMNVCQIAAAVGHTNASHFSSAYKKHYGILPKEHKSRIRKRI